MSQSLSHSLPIELVREIMTWIFQFQQAELAERISVFKSSFGLKWSAIMGDIRMNVPRYTANIIGTGGTRFFLSVYSPTCNPVDWLGAIHHQMFRRALSVQREFFTDNTTTSRQDSRVDAENYIVHPPPE